MGSWEDKKKRETQPCFPVHPAYLLIFKPSQLLYNSYLEYFLSALIKNSFAIASVMKLITKSTSAR